ncbi:Reducing type I polyketide synthase [Lasiodiplodia theobromae]|uniref:Reducing type I polyketide synthase n=1 Tax=Lasiodiplodia theobromae TaxID=45133 RepID=UPI0015C3E4D3|nr:Reducing type I polyketide synthase [Lasiodiplodia theobromae]KAF4537771.1 Reducing type I polyketide synthase [Lasiodiplodia theobromae]
MKETSIDIPDLSPVLGGTVIGGSTTRQEAAAAATMTTHRPDPHEPIAIVGMSCRFPGESDSPEKLFKLCSEARSAWSEFPADRFNAKGFYHPHAERLGTMNVKGAHFLEEDIGLFDASFFNLTSEVASSMDPQLRLQLECTFEALENAGLLLDRIAGSKTSVFSSSFTKDYHDSLLRDPDTTPRYFMTGNGTAMLSNRVSHFFDLRGPSLTIDTACSTSLVALHLACQSLKAGESSMSIVGGANVMLNPDMFVTMSSLGFLSPEGKSFAFDSRASGYGRGEGAATLVLKRLRDALRDGDPIRGVIRGTATNQDGKTPTLTSPSRYAQEELMRACYAGAGLDPKDTTYVEAHGTGTQAGDATEIAAIGAVFGGEKEKGGRGLRKGPLYVGSVKTNIGHLEAASGLAGVIKTALCLEKGLIPPNANFERANERLELEKWNIKIPQRLEPWPDHCVRRASVSSFGYGGTNGHVILDAAMHHEKKDVEHTREQQQQQLLQSRLFSISAKDEDAARGAAARLAEYVQEKKGDGPELFDNLSYTLSARRSRFPWSVSVAATSLGALADVLSSDALKPVRSAGGAAPRLGFVFTGQGAQWHAMGRELLGAYPVFRRSIEDATRIIKEFGAEWSLMDELLRDASTSRVNETLMSLPLCTAVQLSLVDLLTSWGIAPTAVTGHSSGEVGAAYAAGLVDFRSALAIVYLRGELTTSFKLKTPGMRGGMIAVGLGRDEVQEYLARVKKSAAGEVVVACVNSPSSVTVSGDLAGVEELERLLHADEIFARKLKVDAAYHSHHMQPIAAEYHQVLEAALARGRLLDGVVFSSPVTGSRADRVDAAHWVTNMVSPVLFLDSFRNMCLDAEERQQVDLVVEIGPHSALAGPIRQILSLPELRDRGVAYTSCLVRNQDATSTMQAMAGFLADRGYPVDLTAINFPNGADGCRVLHDLPSYAWNHRQKHWAVSRLGRALNQKPAPPHDLAGAKVPGTNPLAPLWRWILRPSEIPWVQDHVVQSHMVYPAAGYISMVLEAVRSNADEQRPLRGIQMREIDVKKALVIPEETAGVEVQLALLPKNEKALASHDWTEFRIFSVDHNDSWSEHCSGFVSAVYGDSTPLSGSGSEYAALGKPVMQPKALYQTLQRLGINHGPAFQNIHSVHGKVTSVFSVADTAALMPARHEQKHLLHPTTLDSVIQTAYLSLPEYGQGQTTAMVPRSIASLFVSSELEGVGAGSLLEAHAKLGSVDARSFLSSVDVKDPSRGHQTVLRLSGLRCQSLGAALQQDDQDQNRLCFNIEWKPYLALADCASIKDLRVAAPSESEQRMVTDLRHACLHFIRDALDELTAADVANLAEHHAALHRWMEIVSKSAELNDICTQNPACSDRAGEWARHLSAVADASVSGRMACRIGEKLVPILRKEIAPLELMLEDRLLYAYYEGAIGINRSFAQVERLSELLGHQNPAAKILEIGAGTGSCTRAVLAGLGRAHTAGSPNFARYDFTDVSPGFFDAAREKFADSVDRMTFRRLDIELDPDSQSFECGTYDVVVACEVLHATKTMDATMANVRKLLKPGGTLLLVETTKDAIDIQLVFGTLPGWWLSTEEERKLSPSLPVASWNKLLQRTGFSGIDLDVQDSEDVSFSSLSVIMSTAAGDAPQRPSSIALVQVRPKKEEAQQAWTDRLAARLRQEGAAEVTVETLETVQPRGRTCIIIDDPAAPLLSDITAAAFEALRGMLTTADGVFWVSHGGTIECQYPEAAAHMGLLRTLRCEDGSRRYITLDLDASHGAWLAESVDTAAKVFLQAFDESRPREEIDFEYAARDGAVLVGRVREDAEANAAVACGTAAAVLKPFSQPGRSLRMEVDTPGLIDSITFHDDPQAEEPLGEDEIEIEPAAFGLNFRDVMVAMGQLDEWIMGYECSGVVSRVGSSKGHGFQPGDRVCAMTRGHYANRVRVSWTAVCKMPPQMSFEEAASVPMVFITAYYSLFEIARLEDGESVLIHAGSGGVGQAAIMLAKLKKADVFVTVGSQEKRAFVRDTYGIPDNRIFSSRDTSFGDAVLAATGGRGVDVALNSLAGPLLEETWRCIAPLGRFVEIGKRDIELNKRLDMAPFRQSVSFAAVDLTHVAAHRGKLISRMLAAVMELLGQGSIKPVTPVTVYGLDELEKAFRLMQAGKHRGKIVIRAGKEDTVKVAPQRPRARLSPDASYVVVGGLGGIGRSVSRLLVQRGARHLVLLSRRGEDADRGFVDELRTAGCAVAAPPCDASDAKALATAAAEWARTMPPVRGVIQAAMALQDSVFERMGFDEFAGGMAPKLRATRNLHELFGGLDFFVMLSSVVGVAGNASQANYAAGGAFQDALAQHRQARGLPGVALDLGPVRSVGFVAESAGVEDRLARIGFRALEEQQVLQLIEAAVAGGSAAQVVTGVASAPAPELVQRAAWLQDARFAGLRAAGDAAGSLGRASGGSGPAVPLQLQLADAASPAAAAQVVCAAVVRKTADIFMLQVDEVDARHPVTHYGVDSLVAVELRNWLAAHARADVSIFDVLQSASIADLAAVVARKSACVKAE